MSTTEKRIPSCPFPFPEAAPGSPVCPSRTLPACACVNVYVYLYINTACVLVHAYRYPQEYIHTLKECTVRIMEAFILIVGWLRIPSSSFPCAPLPPLCLVMGAHIFLTTFLSPSVVITLAAYENPPGSFEDQA